jgi:hypothetical protein
VTLTPTPKVATGGATGIVTAFVLYELSNRFHITLAPEESSFITTAFIFLASYFAPHSAPTPEQIAQIKNQP